MNGKLTNIMEALRNGTQDIHERLDGGGLLGACTASTASYLNVLKRFYGFYEPFERLFYSVDARRLGEIKSLDLVARSKVGLLISDLLARGCSTQDLLSIPKCPTSLLPQLKSAAQLIGCSYVVEGSTLGGVLIGKSVEKHLGLVPGEPGAMFFNAYGSKTGAMWRQFQSIAQSSYQNAAQQGTTKGTAFLTEAIQSARQTFLSIETWLNAGLKT